MKLELYTNDYKHLICDIYAGGVDKLTNGGMFKLLSIFGLFKSSLYVYKNNGQVVGLGCIIRKLNMQSFRMETWLAGIHVMEQFRCQSIGTNMMYDIINECVKKKYNVISLYVDKTNIGACRLYDKVGFWKKCTYKHYWKMEYVIK